MEEKIKDLRQIIPYKWRVLNKKGKDVFMVAYVDARNVADHLDTIIGPSNWCDRYEAIKGNLYCSIGIKIKGEWVFKSDCGVESKAEKVKGESSDAFKRAAVKWGINRDAYNMELVKLEGKEYNGQIYPSLNGRFLKGQELYDHCNKVAKVDEMENYDLISRHEITVDDLAMIFVRVKDIMTADDVTFAERIIKNSESKSYSKLLEKLSEYENSKF